jgi:hypothetical protein
MPKDFEDPPKESTRDKATRKWRNHDIEKRVKEERAKPTLSSPKELEVGDVIENKHPRAGAVTKAQTKFAKEIREMLEAHKKRTLLMYRLSLRTRIHQLKVARLKKLEALAQQNQE